MSKQPGTPRRIGFLVSDTDPGYYGILLNTLQEVCIPLNVRLVVFEGRALDSPLLAPRCYNAVYRMVGGDRLDGLLVATSGFGAIAGPDGVQRFLAGLDMPIRTIGMHLEGIGGINVEDGVAVHAILDHMAEHGYRKIVWASGPPNIIHSRERLAAYRSWLAEKGQALGIREDILFGDFTSRSGFDMMAQLLPRIQDLDAVCYANDNMALGAIEYCNTHSIRVPEDVAVTGIDNIGLSGLVTPGLTTVSQDMSGMAYSAVLSLLADIDGESVPGPLHSFTGHRVVPRHSCGCTAPILPERNAMLQSMMNRNLYIGESVQTFRSDALFERMEQFLRKKEISLCFVMVFEDLPKEMDCFRFELPKGSRMLIGYEGGERLYGESTFPTMRLLPDSFWDRLAMQNLMIKPLFFENTVFGYILSSTVERERAHIEDLRLMISVTLKGEALIGELERMQNQLQWALEAMRTVNLQLSDISLRDELTGLFNRRGFLQEADRYVQGKPGCFLIGFADLNSLKTINDSFGHMEGDQYLRTVADILRHSCREGDIIGRVGGDEFAFLVKEADLELTEVLEARFEEKCRTLSERNGKPYQMSFARGYVQGEGAADLQKLVQHADSRMYAHKAAQKREREGKGGS